jgi:peroxiredoxin
MSHRGNAWLLGGLALFLLLIGADWYVHRPQLPPEVQHMDDRAKKIQTWQPVFPIRSKVPDFRLKDANGQEHSLSGFRDKPLLLLFYSDDKRSRTFAREMNKLWGYLGKDRIRSVVVVTFSPETARAFARESGDASLYLFEDPNSHPVRDQYHAAPGPNAWVIDRKGRVRHATPPITTDANPEQDFHGVYRALLALAPRTYTSSDIPAWARGISRPPADSVD